MNNFNVFIRRGYHRVYTFFCWIFLNNTHQYVFKKVALIQKWHPLEMFFFILEDEMVYLNTFIVLIKEF